MIARTEKDRSGLRTAGKMLASILHGAARRAVPGVSAGELDAFVKQETLAHGAVPVFLNYETDGSPYPYPATVCISRNDEVVHGIPVKEKILSEGDIVSLDCGLSYEGYVVDAAVTVIVGKGSEDLERLLRGTREALEAGIGAARPGGHVGDIGEAIAAVAKKYDLAVVRDLGGHATGKELHEDPYIANFGTRGRGEKLEEGHVLALEPIFTLGGGAIKLAHDGWTYMTADRSRAAHFEHTILLGENGAEILTRL